MTAFLPVPFLRRFVSKVRTDPDSDFGEVAGDGVFDVVQRFGAGLALRNADGKGGPLPHEYSILIRLNYHSILHAVNLGAPPWKVNRHASDVLLMLPVCARLQEQ